jgi:hypothetical protein
LAGVAHAPQQLLVNPGLHVEDENVHHRPT